MILMTHGLSMSSRTINSIKLSLKMKKVIFLSLGIALFLLSCSKNTQKEKTIVLFEEFVNYVDKDFNKITDKDWVKSDTTYYKFCGKFDNKFVDILTETDKEKISRLKGRYNGLKFKYEAGNALNEVKDSFKDVVNQLDGFMDAVN